jgi:O-antigen/teichoic acid export membrane protein
MASDRLREGQVTAGAYGRLAPSQATKRLLSQIGVYGLGNALQRLGAFVLLPVYIARFTPEEYGILTLASLVPFALPPILTLGLPHAITRYYHDWVREGVAAGNLGMVWLAAVGSMLLATLALDFSAGVIWDRLITQVPYHPYLRLALWWAFFSGLTLCPFFLLRIREQSAAFVLVSSGAFFLGTGLNIWVVLSGRGVIGVLWMQVLTNGVVGMLMTMWYLRQVSFDVPGSWFLRAIRFSLPLVPSSFLEVVGHRIDRIFLDRWATLGDIGVYALANQVGQAVKFFYDSVKPAWVPFYIRVSGDRADSRTFLGTMVTLYVAGLCVVAVAVLCFAVDILQWMNPDGRYQGALPLIPIMLGAFFLHGLAPVGSTALLVAERTSWQPAIQLVQVAGVVGANVVLTRSWGVVGAAWAMLSSSGLFSAMYLMVGQIAYPLTLEWPRLLALGLGSAAIAVGVARTSHVGLKTFLLCVLMVGVGIIVSWRRSHYDSAKILEKDGNPYREA